MFSRTNRVNTMLDSRDDLYEDPPCPRRFTRPKVVPHGPSRSQKPSQTSNSQAHLDDDGEQWRTIEEKLPNTQGVRDHLAGVHKTTE